MEIQKKKGIYIIIIIILIIQNILKNANLYKENIRKIERKRRERIKKKVMQKNKTVSNFRHERDRTLTANNNSKILKANSK